jgi:hypothetical protein
MNGVNGSTHRWPRAQAMITAQQQRTAAHIRYPPWSAGKEGLRALPRGQIPPVARPPVWARPAWRARRALTFHQP